MGGIFQNMDTSNRTKCIVVSGIDGSGKSTLLQMLKEELESDGLRIGYIWLRFNHYLTKVMHAIARLMGLSVKVHNDMGDVWQHRLYKSPFYCRVYIFATYIDCLVSRLKYDMASRGRDVMVVDRWIPDILVDLAVKTRLDNYIHCKWESRFLKIMPESAKVLLIDRNEETLLDCRLENRVDPEFRRRLEIYRLLCKSDSVTVIDNNGSISQAIELMDKAIGRNER